MNKKLLAAAVAAAMAAPVAFADSAVIYGKIHPQVIQGERTINGVVTHDHISVADAQNTRLGFKGSEDLGNGLKAVWKYELAYDIDQGGGLGGTARNSYLGLSGSFGTVLAGRHDPAAKGSWYGVGLDFLDGSIVDLNELGGQAAGNEAQQSLFELFADDNRWNNVVHYASPNFNGFSVAATVSAAEGANVAGQEDGFEAYSLGALYKGHGLKIGAGYTDTGNTALEGAVGNAAEHKYWHVSGSYSWGGLVVGATYSDQEDVGDVNNQELTSYAGAAKYTFGNNYVMGNVSWGDFDGGGVGYDGEAFEFGLAIGHMFSKRTQAYLAYNDGEREFDGAGAPADSETQAFGLGMIHVF